MSSKFETLEKLHELRSKGVITEEEFNREKDILLNKQGSTFESGNLLGLKENTYCMFIHLSLLLVLFHPALGIIAPFLLWVLNKDFHVSVDNNGRVVLNWIISMCIYSFILFIIAFQFGINMAFSFGNPFAMLTSFIPIFILYGLNLIFIIIGAIKTNAGEVKNYPLSFRFFKLK